jgi:hypothetical protein
MNDYKKTWQLVFCGATAQLGPRLPLFTFTDHTHLRHPHLWLPLNNDQLISCPTHNNHKLRTSMTWARFEHAIPATQPPQTYASNRPTRFSVVCGFHLVTKHPRSLWQWLTWWQTENGWLTSLQAKVLTQSPYIIQSANLQIAQITLLCHISLLQNSGESRQYRRSITQVTRVKARHLYIPIFFKAIRK